MKHPESTVRALYSEAYLHEAMKFDLFRPWTSRFSSRFCRIQLQDTCHFAEFNVETCVGPKEMTHLVHCKHTSIDIFQMDVANQQSKCMEKSTIGYRSEWSYFSLETRIVTVFTFFHSDSNLLLKMIYKSH